MDILFTLATVVLFTIAILYIKGCDRLKVRPKND